MTKDLAVDYLSGLPPGRAEELARVNDAGLEAMRRYLASGEAVAFLGAGASVPLYPLWDGLIGTEMVMKIFSSGEVEFKSWLLLKTWQGNLSFHFLRRFPAPLKRRLR